jgi:uncharacterized membrane protein
VRTVLPSKALPQRTMVSAAPASARFPSIRPSSARIQSVDALRGMVMILMALDHVRDFISRDAMQFSPTDLTRTTPAIFFTRWITHFCAPTFAFTAGLGAYFWLRRNRTRAQLSRFLVSRGLWLILIELTVLRFVFFLDYRFTHAFILLNVIWMLGLSMIVLAALVHLPRRALILLSLITIAGHNLFDQVAPEQFGRFAWLWDILHQPGAFPVGSDMVLVAYSLVPWFAVMALGYCIGPVFQWDFLRRQGFLLRTGVALTAAFVILRSVNIYGDPSPWSVQHSTLFTILSFLNCTKYPPSLLFLLMTLGPALIAMALLERIQLSDSNPMLIFGRVPFFYFLIHLAVIHGIAILISFIRYGRTPFLWMNAPSLGGSRDLFPADFGVSLWVVYAVWIAVVVALYPVCHRFAQLKRERRDWWLSYL